MLLLGWAQQDISSHGHAFLVCQVGPSAGSHGDTMPSAASSCQVAPMVTGKWATIAAASMIWKGAARVGARAGGARAWRHYAGPWAEGTTR